jgi:hypothetical protein
MHLESPLLFNGSIKRLCQYLALQGFFVIARAKPEAISDLLDISWLA